MKIEFFAEKSFKMNNYYSFSVLPSITVNYKLPYRKRVLNADLFWLLWYVGVELTIEIDE